MPSHYPTLAVIHNELKLATFAKAMTPRIIDFAQRNQWMGRQIVDLGCGNGESLKWLAQHGYIVTGVDNSAEMLTLAQQNMSGERMQPRLIHNDLKLVNDVRDVDLALAIDVLHELNSLKELEDALRNINTLLLQGRWLVFDLYTIEGLVQRSQEGDKVEHDSSQLTVIARNSIDYERTVHKRDYIIYQKQENSWMRADSYRTLRTYPIQAVTALLQRTGFEVLHVLNHDLKPHAPTDNTTRVIIMAQKS